MHRFTHIFLIMSCLQLAKCWSLWLVAGERLRSPVSMWKVKTAEGWAQLMQQPSCFKAQVEGQSGSLTSQQQLPHWELNFSLKLLPLEQWTPGLPLMCRCCNGASSGELEGPLLASRAIQLCWITFRGKKVPKPNNKTSSPKNKTNQKTQTTNKQLKATFLTLVSSPCWWKTEPWADSLPWGEHLAHWASGCESAGRFTQR